MGGGGSNIIKDAFSKRNMESMASGGLSDIVKGQGLSQMVDPMDLFGTRKKETAEIAAKKQDEAIAAQETERLKQEKLIADQKAKEDAATAERKARLAQGRTGLLYGDETGVAAKTTLGG